MDDLDLSHYTNRQKIGFICNYMVKYSCTNDKGVMIPPAEFGSATWHELDAAVGKAFGQKASTVKRLRDLFIARYPDIPQNGWRNPKDPDTGRRPEKMSKTMDAVYRLVEAKSRNVVWSALRKIMPAPYNKMFSVVGHGSGYVADDNNRKPRHKPNSVTAKKKSSKKLTVPAADVSTAVSAVKQSKKLPVGSIRNFPFELEVNQSEEDSPPILNLKITKGTILKVENL